MVTVRAPATPEGDHVEFFLAIIVGIACGTNYGRKSRPAHLQSQAADAIVRFIRAVEASVLSREGVAVVKQTVTDTYDPDTAAYIHARLRETPAAPESN
jgi:hypothetical protein